MSYRALTHKLLHRKALNISKCSDKLIRKDYKLILEGLTLSRIKKEVILSLRLLTLWKMAKARVIRIVYMHSNNKFKVIPLCHITLQRFRIKTITKYKVHSRISLYKIQQIWTKSYWCHKQQRLRCWWYHNLKKHLHSTYTTL